MKLSTRITHARIKLKHKLLRLRVQKPLYYQTLVALMLIVGLGGMVVIYVLYTSKPEVISSTDQPQINIREYSINGKITTISTDQITVTTTAVETHNGINTVVENHKIISLNANTTVIQTSIEQNQIQTSESNINNLSVGDLITAYTQTNPANSDLLPANRIEILK